MAQIGPGSDFSASKLAVMGERRFSPIGERFRRVRRHALATVFVAPTAANAGPANGGAELPNAAIYFDPARTTERRFMAWDGDGDSVATVSVAVASGRDAASQRSQTARINEGAVVCR